MSDAQPSPLSQQEPSERRSRSPIRLTVSQRIQSHSQPPPTTQRQLSPVDFSNVRYEYVAGKRVGSKMLHAIGERQMYRYRVTHKNVAQYNCYIDKCNAKLYVDLTTQVCARKQKFEPHNHGPNDMIEGIQLNDSIKQRCRNAAVATRSASAGNVHNIFLNTIRELVFFFHFCKHIRTHARKVLHSFCLFFILFKTARVRRYANCQIGKMLKEIYTVFV